MVSGNYYSQVGQGRCADHEGVTYPFVFGGLGQGVTDLEVCGGWCAQHITSGFVGYEQVVNVTTIPHPTTICRCLFSADGYPFPIPHYENPLYYPELSFDPSHSTLQGTGPVVSIAPRDSEYCFRYIVSFAFHSNFNHQVIPLSQRQFVSFFHS